MKRKEDEEKTYRRHAAKKSGSNFGRETRAQGDAYERRKLKIWRRRGWIFRAVDDKTSKLARKLNT